MRPWLFTRAPLAPGCGWSRTRLCRSSPATACSRRPSFFVIWPTRANSLNPRERCPRLWCPRQQRAYRPRRLRCRVSPPQQRSHNNSSSSGHRHGVTEWAHSRPSQLHQSLSQLPQLPPSRHPRSNASDGEQKSARARPQVITCSCGRSWSSSNKRATTQSLQTPRCGRRPCR